MYMCMCMSVCARKREYGYVCEPEGSSYSDSCSYNFRGQTKGKHGRPQSLDGEMVFSNVFHGQVNLLQSEVPTPLSVKSLHFFLAKIHTVGSPSPPSWLRSTGQWNPPWLHLGVLLPLSRRKKKNRAARGVGCDEGRLPHGLTDVPFVLGCRDHPGISGFSPEKHCRFWEGHWAPSLEPWHRWHRWHSWFWWSPLFLP